MRKLLLVQLREGESQGKMSVAEMVRQGHNLSIFEDRTDRYVDGSVKEKQNFDLMILRKEN